MVTSPRLLTITARIDRFTDAIGLMVAWLNVPLVLAVSYEVVARYFFNAPTIWVFDVTYMLYGTIFMLGAAYALHKGAHIRTDFFFENWSTRTKGLIELDRLPRLLLSFADPVPGGELAGGLVRLSDRRDLGADAVAGDPVAVQDGRAADLPAADHSGRLGDHQELARGVYRHRARAQGKGGDSRR